MILNYGGVKIKKSLVSINIPFFNRLDHLERCISAIKSYTDHPDYEIVLIDDGSTDIMTSLYAKDASDVYIRHKRNQGIASSRHDGILGSNGEYICELDSDTVVTPGWLTKLLFALDERWLQPAGNRIIYKPVIVSALMAHQVGYFIAAGRLHDHNTMNKYGLIQVEVVGTACTLFSKDLIDFVGNFDIELDNLWSDMDFCKRVNSLEKKFIEKKKISPKIVIDPCTVVYHHGWIDPITGNMIEDYSKNTRSLPELNDTKHKSRQLKSMKIILDRWGVVHPRMKELEVEINAMV